jgi:hypothetical protein
LVAERQIVQQQLVARMKSAEQDPQDGHKQVAHDRQTLTGTAEKSTSLARYRVLATHKERQKGMKN